MRFKTRDVVDKLLGKFHFVDSNSEHKVYYLFKGKRKVARTQISHGGNEIGDHLMKQMAKQVGVYKLNFFKEMILCTKSNDDYLEEITQNGWIDRYK